MSARGSKTSPPVATSPNGPDSTAAAAAAASDADYLYSFLLNIQLESFLPSLRDKLQITRVAHFDYVKPKELEKIGMSKPAIRRLLDAVAHCKSAQLPTRPPPPVPGSAATTNSSQNLAKMMTARGSSSIVNALNNDTRKTKLVSYILEVFDIFKR